ncbi:hypothetical protein G7Y89_g12057 [Cudoniella acicularis]|uniref:Uncharacterized protein n=1 Tax=Cudoniella acicularis TaxID=354080 RepID=A0A8H4R9M2_9HELO|nr:hypothetical protein G7Y89_g12057 [Cudoniella acicularis]
MLNQRVATFALIASLLFIWLVYLNRHHFPSLDSVGDSRVHNWLSPSKNDTTTADQKVDSHNADPQINSLKNGLKNLCDRTHWTPGLWLQCHSYSGLNTTAIGGGLNNARNRIQTCVRLAIDAGSGLIIPPIATTRNADNPALLSATPQCADQFWNFDHMAEELEEQCPQMKLRYCGDAEGIDTILPTLKRHYSDDVHSLGTFGAMVNATLKEANIEKISPLNPVAITYGDSYIAWNYTESNELGAVRKSLFRLIKFNRRLLTFSSEILQSPELQNGFIGVHLRGEPDWPAVFGTVDTQMDAYVKEIEATQSTREKKITTVYVSCGSRGAIGWFRARLEPLGYTVHDKWTLLVGSPRMLAKLDAMEFDKKAIVEYEVLVNADYWYGILMSTMSAMVAYARTVDEPEVYFSTYLYPGSSRTAGRTRTWVNAPAMMGTNTTKLLVTNSAPVGLDLMDSFP